MTSLMRITFEICNSDTSPKAPWIGLIRFNSESEKWSFGYCIFSIKAVKFEFFLIFALSSGVIFVAYCTPSKEYVS